MSEELRIDRCEVEEDPKKFQAMQDLSKTIDLHSREAKRAFAALGIESYSEISIFTDARKDQVIIRWVK